MSWEQNVRRVVPYVAGEQPNKPGIIKLNTNECPYPPAPGVERLLKRMDYGALRLYPDSDIRVLVDALAEYYHVSPGQVFVGVGSDDVISMAFMTFFNGRRPILFPDVTYSFYDVWAKLHGIPYRTCPLDEDWHICPEDYRQPNGGIIFPNPNAPTGLFESLETVERIVRANRDVVVMVDEAYVDFGGESCVPMIFRYDNLLVTQTMSKSRQLAGGRVGFALGSEALIAALNRVKYSFNPYNVNRLSLIAGAAAMEDEAYFQSCCETIRENRAWLKEELEGLGFTVLPSSANFVFARCGRIPGGKLYRQLKENGILVRWCDKDRIRDFVRITVGSMEQLAALVDELARILEDV